MCNAPTIATGNRRWEIKANMPKRMVQAVENYHSEANSINVFLSDEDIFEHKVN